MNLENLPRKPNFFPLGEKKSHRVRSRPDRPLIYCSSKVCSGWVSSGPISGLEASMRMNDLLVAQLLEQKVAWLSNLK